MDYTVIEKLLGHRLQGMGDGYIHNWEHRLRDAVIHLEAMIIKKLSEAEQMRESAVGSYGQLMGSWKNAESYKWLIDGAFLHHAP